MAIEGDSLQGQGSGWEKGVFGLWRLDFGKLFIDILRWLSGAEAWGLVFRKRC